MNIKSLFIFIIPVLLSLLIAKLEPEGDKQKIACKNISRATLIQISMAAKVGHEINSLFRDEQGTNMQRALDSLLGEDCSRYRLENRCVSSVVQLILDIQQHELEEQLRQDLMQSMRFCNLKPSYLQQIVNESDFQNKKKMCKMQCDIAQQSCAIQKRESTLLGSQDDQPINILAQSLIDVMTFTNCDLVYYPCITMC